MEIDTTDQTVKRAFDQYYTNLRGALTQQTQAPQQVIAKTLQLNLHYAEFTKPHLRLVKDYLMSLNIEFVQLSGDGKSFVYTEESLGLKLGKVSDIMPNKPFVLLEKKKKDKRDMKGRDPKK